MRRMGEEKGELQHVMTSFLGGWILPQVTTGFRFIKPKTFHITVLMLKLWNKDRVNAAIEVLKSISSKVMDALDDRPIFELMRGSSAKAHVLYAPVEEMVMMVDFSVHVLHATVMNARHRKSKSRTRKLDSFDARGIFKQYGSEEWREYIIPEAHLLQRFVFDESGHYHCCESIPFPETRKQTDPFKLKINNLVPF
ncbi:hypothetical protein Patl1_34219 [Pistacia atlantica]|uniref:Uncharacterized protein n=1 Tax=Pistacia atlantica TaxID=434234 RepID=A0ACC0ZQW3_9ROSI|nr:hypothetical protein Patl1_34219 [Pistacia atlantica]